MHYAIVDDATGAITSTGTCPSEQFQYKAQTGETAIECDPDIADNTHEYVNGAFVELPGPSDAEKHTECVYITRGARTTLLQDCDWTQVTDSPLSTSDKAAWAVYRQALRDLPGTIGSDILSFEDVVFPTPPA